VPEPPRPTVLLVAHQGFAARFLLRTEILTALQAAGARAVAVVPNPDEPYLAAEMEERGVALEQLRAAEEERGAGGRLRRLVGWLRTFQMGDARSTGALMEKYRDLQAGLRREQPWLARAVDAALRVLWRSPLLRRAVLALDTALDRASPHAELFDRTQPRLVVTTTPGFLRADTVILREARRRGVRTATAIYSWDNPTSKGYRGGDPDHVIAWSERMADQLVRHHDIPHERITVAGVAHWDPYVRPGALPSRDAVFAELGLDPARRTIVYATASPSFYPRNFDVAAALAGALDDGRLTNAQLVVRPHPLNFQPHYEQSDRWRLPIEAYEALAREHAHVHLDIPEVLSRRLKCDLAPSDSRRFGGLLAHADVVVNVFSSTTLEAFLLDRPAVMVCIDEFAARALRYAHLQPVLGAGAARIARTMDEVVDLAARYLAEPELDRAARAEVARAECGPTDGGSGWRAGAVLAELAGLPRPAARPSATPDPMPPRTGVPSTVTSTPEA
jgi:hypothetical protein